MNNIESTLAERGERYGSFAEHAVIAQALQDVMRGQPGWAKLAADQKQALTVIADKIARMLNGDPSYRDNWHDIVGYAKLVDDRMQADEGSAARKLEMLAEDSGQTEAEIQAVMGRDAEGWVEWDANKNLDCPVGFDRVVEVELPSGLRLTRSASLLEWGIVPSPNRRIKRYRVLP